MAVLRAWNEQLQQQFSRLIIILYIYKKKLNTPGIHNLQIDLLIKKKTKLVILQASRHTQSSTLIIIVSILFFHPAGIHSRVKCWGSSTRRRPKRSLPVAAWAWATWCTLWCPTQPTSARPSSWRPCPATPSTCPTPMPTTFPQPMWKGCPARRVFVQSWRKVGSARMGPPRRSPAVCWNSRTCWNMPTSTTRRRPAASQKWRNRWMNWSMKRTWSAGSCRARGTLLLGPEERRGSQRSSRISRAKSALSPSVANPAPTCLPPRVPFQSLCGNSSSSSHPSSLQGWVCCRQLRASMASHPWRTTNSSSRCRNRWASWAPCLAPLHSPTFTATTGPTPPSRPPAATATTLASLHLKATPLSCPWPRSQVGSSLSLWPAPASSPRPARLLRPQFLPPGGPSVAATAALPRPFPTLFPPPTKALGGAASLVLVADLRKQHTTSLSFFPLLVVASPASPAIAFRFLHGELHLQCHSNNSALWKRTRSTPPWCFPSCTFFQMDRSLIFSATADWITWIKGWSLCQLYDTSVFFPLRHIKRVILFPQEWLSRSLYLWHPPRTVTDVEKLASVCLSTAWAACGTGNCCGGLYL